MRTIDTTFNKNRVPMIFGALLFMLNTAWAESDMKLMEKALMARESQGNKGMDHSAHAKNADANGQFRGVFYGYLPCEQSNCDGLKTTLSLKQKNNYLLVTQNAKAASREYYEKGKYEWDEKTRILTLTPKKKTAGHRFSIKDESSLVQLKADGSPMPGDPDDYTLLRSDSVKNREVHIH